MTVDETELELLSRPCFSRNPFIRQPASDVDTGVQLFMERHRVARFRGKLLIAIEQPYFHYGPLTKAHFDQLAAQLLLGFGRSIGSVYHYLRIMAPDLSDNDQLIAFGTGNELGVWDMATLTLRSDIAVTDCIWHSPYLPANLSGQPAHLVTDLTGGSQACYNNIMQSIAPLIMQRKPEGIIWWVGDNVFGVTELTKALHKLFPGQLANLNIQRLGGRRVLPELNRMFGNIVTEFSDSKVHNNSLYKLLASHEDVNGHLYHSQSGMTVHGNVHHIFPVKQQPTFSERNYATARRTVIIPIAPLAVDGPAKQNRQSSDSELQQLLAEMISYAKRLGQQGGQYKLLRTVQMS